MDGKKPYMVALLIQSIYAGMFLLSKAALTDGMSSFVFIFYRQLAGSIVFVPVAVILGRKGAPQLSKAIFFKMFMLALFGLTFSLNIYGIALEYTSSSVAAAATNTLPAITFFLAILARMEVFDLRSSYGIAKVVGIVICLAGDATIALYKGPQLKSFNHHHLLSHPSNQVNPVDVHATNKWVKGCFLMLTSNVLWGSWLVFQGGILKNYPSKFLFTAMQCLLSTIQSFIVAVIFVRDPTQWKLKLDIRLLAVAYSGIIITGVGFYLQSWCIDKRGPVFLSAFSPLSLVITIICSMFILGELISLGSILGGALMVAGLYSVLWGKCKEHRIEKQKQLTLASVSC